MQRNVWWTLANEELAQLTHQRKVNYVDIGAFTLVDSRGLFQRFVCSSHPDPSEVWWTCRNGGHAKTVVRDSSFPAKQIISLGPCLSASRIVKFCDEKLSLVALLREAATTLMRFKEIRILRSVLLQIEPPRRIQVRYINLKELCRNIFK